MPIGDRQSLFQRTNKLKPLFLLHAFSAFAGLACGRVGLDQPAVDDRADARPIVDAADAHPGADAADAADERAPTPVPDAGADLPVGPFALTVRLTNVGVDDVRVQLRPSVCSDDIVIQGDAPVESPTSIQEPDYSCDCKACPSPPGAPFRCVSTDFICDQPPFILRPGEHYDFGWDGTVLAWLSPPPPDSACVGRCTAFLPVPAGTYTFTYEQGTRAFSTTAFVPPPDGIIEIAVSNHRG